MPSKQWSTPIIQNVVYQNAYTPQPTPQSSFIHQKPQISTIHTGFPPTPMDLESPFSQVCYTPYDRVPRTPWSAGPVHTPTAVKSKHGNGLGLNFVDQEHDLTPSTLSGTTTESFEDLIRLDEMESWDFNPVSPDRRSWSSISASSDEALPNQHDLPELCEMPTLDLHMPSDLGMSFRTNSPILNHLEASPMRPSGRSAHHQHRQSTHSYRTSPYSVSRTRSSSTSTAPLSLPKTQCCSPLEVCQESFELNDGDFQVEGSTMHSANGAMFDPCNSDMDFYFPTEQLMPSKPNYGSDSLFMSAPYPEYHSAPPILPSSGFFETGHENGSGNIGDHYNHDLADEPDLFGPLSEEQIPPPEEDMKPEDPELEPRSQELRFEGDLYTPQYVRGHGNKREGWCGICKPGRWLVLKNSAFWYDKSFTHGISAATGLPFEGPKETRRMSGNPDVWEGLCGSCGDWIALISSKKKGTTWFRHAYKCHTHQKAKDTPKRRREPAQNRATKSYKTKKSKQEPREQSLESVNSPLDGQQNTEVISPGRSISAFQMMPATM
ncbi:hypothetical protein MMC18_000013 [Xylographa bjoerkii]|nr:hypothetical protein [Xylographa bjoerkii]